VSDAVTGPDRRAIYVVSDSTGETGAKLLQAALLQFRHEQVSLRIFSNTRNVAAIKETVDKAASEGALIVYTLVNREQREALTDRAAEYRVQAVDLMGPLMARMGLWLGESPVSMPGLLHRMDGDYFRRVEAVEFAVKNDDGQLPRNFKHADILVIGVSRTSKTPVCSAIAARGYKVANLPLVSGVAPPKELYEMDPRRVYALTIEPASLLEIRQARLRYLGVKDDKGYADIQTIRRELTEAMALFRQHPDWTVIEVTRRAVEETASDILAHYSQHFGAHVISGN